MHWGVGLNKKVVARFYYPKDSADLRLMIGACLPVWLRLFAVRVIFPGLQCAGALEHRLRRHVRVRSLEHRPSKAARPASCQSPPLLPSPALLPGDELRLRHPCPPASLQSAIHNSCPTVPFAGDELRLRHPCPRAGSPPWVGQGFVSRLDDASEEVAIELRAKEKGQASAPNDVTTGFVGEKTSALPNCARVHRSRSQRTQFVLPQRTQRQIGCIGSEFQGLQVRAWSRHALAGSSEHASQRLPIRFSLQSSTCGAVPATSGCRRRSARLRWTKPACRATCTTSAGLGLTLLGGAGLDVVRRAEGLVCIALFAVYAGTCMPGCLNCK